MSTGIKNAAPSETTTDLSAIIDAMIRRQPADPAVSRRVHERAEKVRDDLRRRGVANIAVDLLRESRDEA